MPFIPENENFNASQELFSIENVLFDENEDLGGMHTLAEMEPFALLHAFDAEYELEPGEIPEYDINDQPEPEGVNNLPPMNDDELAEIPPPTALMRQDTEVIYWPHLMPDHMPHHM